MKRFLIFILSTVLFTSAVNGQVTVTNPANTTPNLAATYTSLANAITALDAITAISGPVVITLNSGNNQTAPAGGYVIQFTATTTTANTVTISGSGNTITASSALTAGSTTDGIFKIVGADYITLENFVMQENAANATTAAASNNMTEWGVALLHTATGDGAQNNTIQNNSISLSRSYTNSFGIYSNARHLPTSVTTPSDAPNTATGPNNYNKIYGNNISNVNMGITFIGSPAMDIGNDIGGSAPATGNIIASWGGAAAATGFISNSATSHCIFINQQLDENVSYNTLTSAALSGTSVNVTGIRKDYSASAPSSLTNTNISNNTITITCGFTSALVTAILSQGILGVPGSVVNINSNAVLNCALTAPVNNFSSFTGISNVSVVGTLNINDNSMQGITSLGQAVANFTGISNTASVLTAININNNVLGVPASPLITFSLGASSCTAISNTASGFGSTVTISNNVVDGMNWATGGTLYGIANTGGSASNVNINNNIVRRLALTATSSSATIVGILNSASLTRLTVSGNVVNSNSFTSTSSSASFTSIQNSGLVSNTLSITNNQLGNASGGALTVSNLTSGAITGISNSAAASSATVNLNDNSFDGYVIGISGAFQGISNSGQAGVNNIKNNQFGTVTGSFVRFNFGQSAQVSAIVNNTINTAATLSIQGNDIRGITYATSGSSPVLLVSCLSASTSQTISDNTFTNLTLNTTGSVFCIDKQGGMGSGMTWTCNNNSVVTGFAKTGTAAVNAGFLNLSGPSVNGSAVVITGNNFSNASFGTATIAYGIKDGEGFSATNGPTKTVTGNIFNNISSNGDFYGIWVDKGNSLNCSTNTITNVSVNSNFWGVWVDRSASVSCSNNTITNVSSANGTNFYGIMLNTGIGTGTVNVASNMINQFSCSQCKNWGVYGGSTQPSLTTINDNVITNFTTSGLSGGSTGINLLQANNADIYQNTVNSFSASGADGSTSVNGIRVSGQNTLNVYRNKIHSLQHSGGVFGTVTCVNGLILAGGITVTAYNNFISNLLAPNATKLLGVIGLSITSTTSGSTYNVYYNSVYVNASSTGANFGTAGLYHTDNATSTLASLNLINNIIVNTSISNGSGFTAAYQRSGSTLGNYASSSDYNLFYAGVPSATKVIFYDGTNSDQTLSAYQTRVNTRDANSISAMPSFVSATDLHLTGANCQINNRGIQVASVTTDIDAQARNAAIPDIGADEFTATTVNTLAGVVGSAVCESRTLGAFGTIYRSNACEPIAGLSASGGDPLAGRVNVCVTLDATQPFFNGEPYVQRHFDIEPAVSNQTTTSARVTLFFNDAEFIAYNTNNPVWPQLPTSVLGNADPNRANVRITQFHGVGTTNPTSPGNYPGTSFLITPGAANVFWNGNYWEVTFNVAGFSGFYLHTTITNAPLPIIVNYLTGRRQGSNHLLNWKVTCATTPRATMVLERSGDGRNYTGINTITADAARCNQPFDYTDANPLKGMNYYRLKIIDADGHVTYSTTVALLNAAKGFDIISIAPNPVVTDKLNLNVASAVSGKLDISIFDMQGRLVSRQAVTLISGFNSLPVNVISLPAGTYTIRAGMAEEQPEIMRFVKQ